MMFIAQIIVALGGSAVIVGGLAWFIAKALLHRDTQKHNTELARLRAELEEHSRRIQGQIDRSLFMHRAQFDKEFACMQNIWEALARLRAVYPVLEERPRDGVGDAEWRERVSVTFQKRLWALLKAVDWQTPFYPEDLYPLLDDAIRMSRTSLTLATTESPMDTPDYYQHRRSSRSEFERAVKDIATLIRARLASLVIVSTQPD